MLECAIHPITYRGEGILATVVKKIAVFVWFVYYFTNHFLFLYIFHILLFYILCIYDSFVSFHIFYPSFLFYISFFLEKTMILRYI